MSVNEYLLFLMMQDAQKNVEEKTAAEKVIAEKAPTKKVQTKKRKK